MNVILCAVFSLLSVCFISSCDIADNEKYFVPENFNGRVLILFNRADGTPKEYDGWTRVYRIPEDGVLKTQFAPNEGWHAIAKVFRTGRAEYEVPVVLEPRNFDQDIPYACCWSLGVYQGDANSKQFSFEQFYIGTREQISRASEEAEREKLDKYTEP